jgi:hypothetical protein
MNEICPVCGLRFRREAGYFLGAMYVSYPLAALVLWVFHFLIGTLLFPEWRWELSLLAAVVPFLLCVPMIFRYSRVIWMFVDRYADPMPDEPVSPRTPTPPRSTPPV